MLLDEIGDTTPALQVRLLRVLEEGEVRPVGGSRALRVTARVIAATNVPLEQAVADGRFRQDLYYRLSVIVIRVPPLRERRADIPLLIGSFLDDACPRAGKKNVLSADALEALLRHPWPGNVRELRNTIERLVVSSRGSLIEAFDLAGDDPAAQPRPTNSRSRICRHSTISSAATCCTCSRPHTATGRARPRFLASIAGRCIGWPNGSASSSRSDAQKISFTESKRLACLSVVGDERDRQRRLDRVAGAIRVRRKIAERAAARPVFDRME